MKSLKGTQTAENLANAFAGESQARNRYTYYAQVAEKEGHHYIADVFRETAYNERAHAEIFYNYLVEGLGAVHIKVDAEYPIGKETTLENLKYAADGEKEEWGTLYPNFSKIAKEEGFPQIAHAFNEIGEVEERHESRYLAFYYHMKEDTLYKREESIFWKCSNCGYIHEGKEVPGVCPACRYPKGYFEPLREEPYDDKEKGTIE